MNQPRFFWLAFFLITASAILCRFPFIQTLPFDSDQAIIGLMAKHMAQGEFPLFFYGNSFYEGILEAALASISFSFFGVSRFNLHLIPFLFSILFIISIFQLGRELFNRAVGLLSMLFAAIPLYYMGLYSALANGGYIEIMWLGNLLLLYSHRYATKKGFSPSRLFFLGFFSGLAWWTHPLSIIYLLTSYFFLCFKGRGFIIKGKFLIAAFGVMVGSLPFWIWNIQYRFPFLKFSRLQENPNYFFRINKFFYGLITVFNPALKGKLSLMAYGIAALFLVSFLFLLIGKKWRRREFSSGHASILLFIFFMSFCFIYVGSRFSEQDALRYFLPLYSLIPITLAFFCWALKSFSKILSVGMMAVLLIANGDHQISLIHDLKNKSILYQKQLQMEDSLFAFLRQKKNFYVYAPEYWSAVELTFNAQENPVFSLPFKDRYPLYTLLADAAPKTAFVLEGKYRQSFEEMFKAMGGAYKREVFSIYQKIKGYVLYYDFEPPSAASQEILPLGWKGQSNVNLASAQWAFDRNIATSWSSSSSQQPGMFYQIDLGRIYKINRIVLLCGKGKEWDFPVNYRIELSNNERDWKETASVKNNWAYLFWSGGRPFWKLRDGRIENNFNPQDARFIRITITDPAPQAWSIGEIFVYQSDKQVKSNPVSAEEIVSFFVQGKDRIRLRRYRSVGANYPPHPGKNQMPSRRL